MSPFNGCCLLKSTLRKIFSAVLFRGQRVRKCCISGDEVFVGSLSWRASLADDNYTNASTGITWQRCKAMLRGNVPSRACDKRVLEVVRLRSRDQTSQVEPVVGEESLRLTEAGDAFVDHLRAVESNPERHAVKPAPV